MHDAQCYEPACNAHGSRLHWPYRCTLHAPALTCMCLHPVPAAACSGCERTRRRNELVALDMVMTILTMGFAFVAMIAGIFGMNLGPLPIQDDNVRPSPAVLCLHGVWCHCPGGHAPSRRVYACIE